MRRAADIEIGRGTVVQHNDGGWALPGNRITHSAIEATDACKVIDAIISVQAARDGLAPKPPVKAEVTRRAVSGNDAVRHTVSA